MGGALVIPTPLAQSKKSFLVLFFKKEPLSLAYDIDTREEEADFLSGGFGGV